MTTSKLSRVWLDLTGDEVGLSHSLKDTGSSATPEGLIATEKDLAMLGTKLEVTTQGLDKSKLVLQSDQDTSQHAGMRSTPESLAQLLYEPHSQSSLATADDPYPWAPVPCNGDSPKLQLRFGHFSEEETLPRVTYVTMVKRRHLDWEGYTLRTEMPLSLLDRQKFSEWIYESLGYKVLMTGSISAHLKAKAGVKAYQAQRMPDWLKKINEAPDQVTSTNHPERPRGSINTEPDYILVEIVRGLFTYMRASPDTQISTENIRKLLTDQINCLRMTTADKAVLIQAIG